MQIQNSPAQASSSTKVSSIIHISNCLQDHSYIPVQKRRANLALLCLLSGSSEYLSSCLLPPHPCTSGELLHKHVQSHFFVLCQVHPQNFPFHDTFSKPDNPWNLDVITALPTILANIISEPACTLSSVNSHLLS